MALPQASIPRAAAGSHSRIGSGELDRREYVWGGVHEIGSAAFWVDQAHRSAFPSSPRLGETLLEELAACLLGGYGVTGEMTLAAFHAVRQAGLLTSADHSPGAFEMVLREPIRLAGRSSSMRYRFPAQRAHRLAGAKRMLVREPPPEHLSPRELREWLLAIPGVGPKTASWVVRNLLVTDDIAIIDIHVHRAGLVAGVFDASWRLPRDYGLFEAAFCEWAAAGDIATWKLDMCIWQQLSMAARLGVRIDR